MMETRHRSSIWVKMLKVLGIVVAVLGIISLFAGMGSAWGIDCSSSKLLEPAILLLMGLHCWTIGVIIDRFKAMSPKQRKALWVYLVMLCTGAVIWIASSTIDDMKTWDRESNWGIILIASSWAAGLLAIRKEEE